MGNLPEFNAAACLSLQSKTAKQHCYFALPYRGSFAQQHIQARLQFGFIHIAYGAGSGLHEIDDVSACCKLFGRNALADVAANDPVSAIFFFILIQVALQEAATQGTAGTGMDCGYTDAANLDHFSAIHFLHGLAIELGHAGMTDDYHGCAGAARYRQQ